MTGKKILRKKAKKVFDNKDLGCESTAPLWQERRSLSCQRGARE